MTCRLHRCGSGAAGSWAHPPIQSDSAKARRRPATRLRSPRHHMGTADLHLRAPARDPAGGWNPCSEPRPEAYGIQTARPRREPPDEHSERETRCCIDLEGLRPGGPGFQGARRKPRLLAFAARESRAARAQRYHDNRPRVSRKPTRLCRSVRSIPARWRARGTGGDAGIRTLDTGFGPYAPLAGECLRPLGHVSKGAGILPAGACTRHRSVLRQGDEAQTPPSPEPAGRC